MPGPPIARLGDIHSGPCTMGVPAPIMPPCCLTVLVGKRPAARVTDICAGVAPHPIAKGSFTCLIGKMPTARIGDLCAGGGAIALGEFTVLAGG